jgi:hypothetical protein
MATSLRGISSTACREDLGAMIRRLALSPFGYFVRRLVQGQISRWLSCYVVVRVVLPPLELSLAWDRQPVERILGKLNNVRGNSKARRSHLVKPWDPMTGTAGLGVASGFPLA